MDIYINIVPSRCSLWTSNNITNTCRTGGNSLNRTPWAHPRNCQVLQIHHLIELHSSPGRVWTCYLVPETGTNKDKHDSKVCENMRKSCFTLPAKKTYPLPRPFWRWVSFSQVGICSFCGGGNPSCSTNRLHAGHCLEGRNEGLVNCLPWAPAFVAGCRCIHPHCWEPTLYNNYNNNS